MANPPRPYFYVPTSLCSAKLILLTSLIEGLYGAWSRAFLSSPLVSLTPDLAVSLTWLGLKESLQTGMLGAGRVELGNLSETMIIRKAEIPDAAVIARVHVDT